jgi:hypothetical protein
METFDQIWESSRTNAWSWVYPTVLWAGVGLLIALSLFRTGWIRRASKTIAILALTVVATEYARLEIQEKWRIRGEWADAHQTLMTPSDQEALTVDGANLTLGPLIHGVQAFALFVVVAVALSAVRITVSRVRRKQPEGTQPEAVTDAASRRQSNNPDRRRRTS